MIGRSAIAAKVKGSVRITAGEPAGTTMVMPAVHGKAGEVGNFRQVSAVQYRPHPFNSICAISLGPPWCKTQMHLGKLLFEFTDDFGQHIARLGVRGGNGSAARCLAGCIARPNF